jgi:hypothetical protein
LSIPAEARPGQTVKFSFNVVTSGQLYAAFVQGLETIYVPIDLNMEAQIPSQLKGTVFVIVTNNNSKTDDSVTVAGPTIATFPFNSAGQLE